MGKWIKIFLILTFCAAFLIGCVSTAPEEITTDPTPSVLEATETTLQAQDTSSVPSATEATTESDVGESQLPEIQYKLQQDGALCAVAHVGYCGGTFAEIQEGFVTDGLTEVLPILSEIGEEHFFSNDGSELYLIVPGEGIGLTVMERSMDENTGETLYGDTLYSENEGLPILLRGNISDIFPNLSLMIEGQGGETVEYSPFLSLKDGMLWIDSTLISDFTPYEILGIYTGPDYEGEDPLISSWFAEVPNTAGETMLLELLMKYDGSASYCYGPVNSEVYELFAGSWFYEGDLLCLSLFGGPLGESEAQYSFYGEFRWEYKDKKLILHHAGGNSLLNCLEGGSVEFGGANQAVLVGLWTATEYISETESNIYTVLELLGDGGCDLLIHNGNGITYASYEGTWSLNNGLLELRMQMYGGNNHLDSITQNLNGSYEAMVDADGWLKLSLLQGDTVTSYMSESGYDFFQPTVAYG